MSYIKVIYIKVIYKGKGFYCFITFSAFELVINGSVKGKNLFIEFNHFMNKVFFS